MRAGLIVVALALLLSTGCYLEALSLGEDTAHSLGFGARSLPWRVMKAVVLAASKAA